MTVTIEKKKALFFSMLRIRLIQETIESKYLEDEMKTPIHLCIGQEAVAVGFCSVLEKEDYITSNHRGHGHYLAKGGDLSRMVAELHCKSDGCSKGFGGSMHLVDTAIGHMGSSSIVGGGIPIATGLGLSIKMQSRQAVSVVFFGDGAADEGVLYESINFAMLKKLPVIFVLENNQWSVCSPVINRQTGDNVFHHLSDDRLLTRKIDGNDVLTVYETAQRAVHRAREGFGPSFIECETYRIVGHAGCDAQDLAGYREAEEVCEWREKCPIERLESELLYQGVTTADEVSRIKEDIRTETELAFEFARKSPLPSENEMTNYLFRNE